MRRYCVFGFNGVKLARVTFVNVCSTEHNTQGRSSLLCEWSRFAVTVFHFARARHACFVLNYPPVHSFVMKCSLPAAAAASYIAQEIEQNIVTRALFYCNYSTSPLVVRKCMAWGFFSADRDSATNVKCQPRPIDFTSLAPQFLACSCSLLYI